ncbi:MAG: hypothetical protein ACRDIC_15700 [bacterium]
MPRIVTLSQTMELAGVQYRIVIVDTAPPVTGSLTVLSGDRNRERLEARFGCPMRQAAPAPEWQCSVPFRSRAPDWGALLRQLDRAGLMAPPIDSSLRLVPVIVCSDGTPWNLTVQSPAGAVLVRDEQVCGPTSAQRDAYEEQVEAVAAAVVALADSV